MSDQPSPYSEGTTLGCLLTDAERERLRDAEATVQCLTAETVRLREVEAAARALVGALTYGKDSGDAAGRCYRCGALATYALHEGRAFVAHGCDRCDRHGLRAEQLSYAPAWRRLVEVVKP